MLVGVAAGRKVLPERMLLSGATSSLQTLPVWSKPIIDGELFFPFGLRASSLSSRKLRAKSMI